jgi:hypothetical protein
MRPLTAHTGAVQDAHAERQDDVVLLVSDDNALICDDDGRVATVSIVC